MAGIVVQVPLFVRFASSMRSKEGADWHNFRHFVLISSALASEFADRRCLAVVSRL